MSLGQRSLNIRDFELEVKLRGVFLLQQFSSVRLLYHSLAWSGFAMTEVSQIVLLHLTRRSILAVKMHKRWSLNLIQVCELAVWMNQPWYRLSDLNHTFKSIPGPSTCTVFLAGRGGLLMKVMRVRWVQCTDLDKRAPSETLWRPNLSSLLLTTLQQNVDQLQRWIDM